MKKNTWIIKTISVLLILVASVSLFLAQSAYWVNHTIFNQENFTATVTEAVLLPTSRDAIASSVVDTALADKPVIKRIIGDRAEKLISSLLDSDLSNQAITRVVNMTYKYITTPDREDIKIELSGITGPISTILTLVQAGDSNAAQTINSIPDEIVLLESDAAPDLSGVVSLMLWVGPLLWLVTLGAYALYIYLHRKNYAKAVYIAGASIIVVAILGALARPALPPPVASLIPVSNLRPVALNVTDAFLVSFQSQMVSMLLVTVIVLIVFSQRYRIVRWAQKVGSMVGTSPAQVSEPKAPAKKTPAKKATTPVKSKKK
ncbi:MAG: hypothetical protein WAQ27_01025 [Candidatus Microsaccharimonas sp.]